MGALENKKNSCLVDLTDVILAVEDANLKTVDVVKTIGLPCCRLFVSTLGCYFVKNAQPLALGCVVPLAMLR